MMRVGPWKEPTNPGWWGKFSLGGIVWGLHWWNITKWITGRWPHAKWRMHRGIQILFLGFSIHRAIAQRGLGGGVQRGLNEIEIISKDLVSVRKHLMKGAPKATMLSWRTSSINGGTMEFLQRSFDVRPGNQATWNCTIVQKCKIGVYKKGHTTSSHVGVGHYTMVIW